MNNLLGLNRFSFGRDKAELTLHHTYQVVHLVYLWKIEDRLDPNQQFLATFQISHFCQLKTRFRKLHEFLEEIMVMRSD